MSTFWKTMEIIMGREYRKTPKDARNDVEEWVERVIARRDREESFKDDELPLEPIVDLKKASKKKSKKKVRFVEELEEDEAEKFFKSVKLPKVLCKFSHPYIRSRLEKLMGSNMVSLTDRAYMQRLQERILEDYAHSMSKRITLREAEEMERVKNLVLTGKIPMDQAPPEMANHPVMLIENYCNKLIAARRAKLKVLKVNIPRYLYWDDTPDPPSGLSIEKGHVFRSHQERLCTPPEHYVFIPDEEDVEGGYMFTQEEFEKLKYESPLIKELRSCETVEEMYALADEIIGAIKSLINKEKALSPTKEQDEEA